MRPAALGAAALGVAVLAVAPAAGAVVDPSAGQAEAAVVSPAQSPSLRILRVISGTGAGRLLQPFGVAIGPRRRLWVLDRAAGRLAEFSPEGAPLASFADHGRGALDQPEGLAVSTGGDIFVADTGHGRVVEYAPSGAVLAVLAAPPPAIRPAQLGSAVNQPSRPTAVAVAPSGQILVADQGGNRIESFSRSGDFRRSIPVLRPDGIAVSRAGDIWVCTDGFPRHNKIREFSPAGRLIRSFGKTQARLGALSDPAALAIGPGGRIYISQPDYGWVTVFNPDGSFAAQFGARPGGSRQSLAFPEGLAITPAGRVWVADSGAGRAVEFAAIPRPASGRGTGPPWLLFALTVLALLALLGGGFAVRGRRRGRPTTKPGGPVTSRAASSPPRDSAAFAAPPRRAPAPDLPRPDLLNRRSLIGGATLLTGAAVCAGILPVSLTRALAATATQPRRAALRDIQHIVILMQENRSFDHYFGTMPGVRGFGDIRAIRLPDGRAVFDQPDPSHRQGFLRPFHYDTAATSAQATPGLDHSWATQHQAWAHGKMDAWVAAKGPFTMGYFEQADIPFHWALAEAFTICDNYHCSVLGPTDPNRLHMWTGMVDPRGLAGGPVTSDATTFKGQTLSWTTYPERLERAGVSWQVYQEVDNYDNNALAWFTQFSNARPSSPLYQRGMLAQPAGTFEDDARADRLPQVSWLVAPTAQSEHPRYFPAAGAEYIAQKLDALAANPDVWAKTAFILTYDENDGLFDHVPPPVPPPGTPGEFIGGEPIGLGFRVPATIVSPWTAGGYVCSEVFDHTSLLRLLETRFGVPEPNITAWRRRTCGDLISAFRLGARPARYPNGDPRLRLPAAEAGLLTAQLQVSKNPGPAIPAENEPLPRR
jgi:phospholipase C